MTIDLNRKLPMVDPSHFAMVPRSDVPRSTFKTRSMRKTTVQTGYLIPWYVKEVLPGDTIRGNVTLFARISNLLFPLMDNMQVETFFFFIPNRILWPHWENMMGEQDSPGDSIAFTVPVCTSPAGGFAINSIFDYMGLPCAGQVTAGKTVTVNSLPLRAYNLTYNQWFRDEDLINWFGPPYPYGDGPDSNASFILRRRAKRHDYFTSCRPWPLKGGVETTLPLGTTATVKTNASALFTGVQPGLQLLTAAAGAALTANRTLNVGAGSTLAFDTVVSGTGPYTISYPSNLYADLSTAVGPTINAMRLAVATQQFLEKDARGGTRYTEILRNHFGVTPQDARLQRPEYIGGGRSPVHTQAIPQTSASTPGTGPFQGQLAAQALVADRHRFLCNAQEHGYILGILEVTADLTYQQGLHRMWTRSTRFDFYWPTFANLGEQAVRNDELYCTGDVTDTQTFGYQERWAEYRYDPSTITGLFNSKHAGAIDQWHLAQNFTALPTLNQTFIEDTPPMSRVLAAGTNADNMQVLIDSMFDIAATRPIPTYSVPGLKRF